MRAILPTGIFNRSTLLLSAFHNASRPDQTTTTIKLIDPALPLWMLASAK